MRFVRIPIDEASLQAETKRHQSLQDKPVLFELHRSINVPLPLARSLPGVLASSGNASVSSSSSSPSSSSSSSSAGTLGTPLRTSSPAHTSTQNVRAAEIEEMLRGDARARLDPRWYTISAAGVPLRSLQEILAAPEVQEAWDSAMNGRNYRAEKDLEAGVVRLLLAFASASRRIAGVETNWPVSHGLQAVRNPASDDVEENRPDVLVVREEGSRGYRWTDVLGVVEVKLKAASDAGAALTAQVFRYARKLAQYNPVTRHAHVVTWCGPLLRLWCFESASYCVSRAYDLRAEADRMDIGRMLWLLIVADERDSLLKRWQPVVGEPLSLVLRGERTSGWTWASIPVPIAVRPSLFGSRTVVSRASLQPPDSAAPVAALVKCSWILPVLAGHETKIQATLPPGPRTPRPLGQVCVDGASALQRFTSPSHPDGRSLHLDVLVYQHREGKQISDVGSDMSEGDIAAVFAQVARELAEYAGVGVHYRDFNVGNVLVEVDERGSLKRSCDGRPVLVLVDHGNARQGLQRRWGPGPALCDRAAVQGILRDGGIEVPASEAPEHLLESLALDDVRSANPIYLPHNVDAAREAYDLFEAARHVHEASRAELQEPAISPSSRRLALRQRERSEADLKDARCEMYTSSHRFVDDLESSVWLLLWLLANRGGRAGVLEESMRRKRQAWTRATMWQATLLRTVAPDDSSQALRTCFGELRETIYAAQHAVRARLREHFLAVCAANEDLAFNGPLPAELDLPLQEIERRCFADVAKLLDEFASH